MANKANMRFEIKALDEDARTIVGWASTPDEDRMGDIVVPTGAKYELPMPFLLDHDHQRAVGEVDSVEITEHGIKFKAHIKNISEPGAIKDLCDSAWALVKNGLRRAVSIGFRPLEMEALPTGGLKFSSWEWYELSAVSVPAQANARITGTKNYTLTEKFVAVDTDDDTPAVSEIPEATEQAAIGKKSRVVKLDASPAIGRKPFVVREIKHTKKKED